jgi:hypothetical protein
MLIKKFINLDKDKSEYNLLNKNEGCWHPAGEVA